MLKSMKMKFILPIALLLTACNNLVSISDPTDRIPSAVAFSTDQLANAAMNGVYQSMLSLNGELVPGFSSGNTTLFGALSADELVAVLGTSSPFYNINTNHLMLTGSPSTLSSPTDNLWSSAYSVIYSANSVIEGIADSRSAQLRDAMRQSLTAEAKFLRAFCYFHLVNFFGDVPLILTTDYNTGISKGRTPREQVYTQIVRDLTDARDNLSADYPSGNAKRVRVNKWTAAALLARVYLFTGDYANAAAQSSAVINNAGLYGLEYNLDKIYLSTSREAIWQLDQQFSAAASNATPDGQLLLPFLKIRGTDSGAVNYSVTSRLLDAFEPGDVRREKWIDSLTNYYTGQSQYYAGKYNTGLFNQVRGAVPTEYAMVLRLAEQYLIRAEAAAHNAGGGAADALKDINIIRSRAGLPGLPANLTQDELLAAVAQEWRIEFLCEWGFRWFNLKRTGKAATELAQIPLKQPWAGDYQLLYPVPPNDVRFAPTLKQNPGY